MTRVKILDQTFSGFPEGVDAPERSFISGEIYEVDDDFAKLVVEKGLAVLVTAKPSPSKVE